MIKLEDLKKNDIIYAVWYDKNYREVGKYSDIKVYKEKCMVDTHPNPIEGVICQGAVEILTRKYEPYLFRTEKERDSEFKRIRQSIIDNFENDDYLKNLIFTKATTYKRLNEYYKELFKDILGIKE